MRRRHSAADLLLHFLPTDAKLLWLKWKTELPESTMSIREESCNDLEMGLLLVSSFRRMGKRLLREA